MVVRRDLAAHLKKLGLYLSVMLIPLNGFVLFNVGSYPISVTFLASSALFIILILSTGGVKKIFKDTVSRAAFLLIVPAILSGVGTLVVGLEFRNYLGSLAYSIYLPLLFIMISNYRLGDNDIRILLSIVVGAGAIISLIGIYQAVANTTGMVPQLVFRLNSPITGPQRQFAFGAAGEYLRPTSVFAEPSWLGHYLVLVVLAAGMLIYRTRRQLIVLAFALIISIALLSTSSIGTYIAFGGAISLSILHNRKRSHIFVFGGLLLIFILAISGLLGRSVYTKIINDTVIRFDNEIVEYFRNPETAPYAPSSTGQRLWVSKLAVSLWAENPAITVVGCGIGGFQDAIFSYYGEEVTYSGTGWTSVLVEQGILGFIFYAYFMVVMVRGLRPKLRRIGENRNKMADNDSFFLLCMFLFLLPMAGITGGLGFERSLTFWLVLSIAELLRKNTLAKPRHIPAISSDITR